MKTAKVIQEGEGQTVLLPDDIRFDDTEVFVRKSGNIVHLIPRSESWDSLFKSLERFSGDFMERRDQPEVEKRGPTEKMIGEVGESV